jgi:Fic family protein
MDSGQYTGHIISIIMQKTREHYDHPSAFEPLFPTDQSGELREAASELLRKSAGLGGSLHEVTRHSVVELLRAMNSYYSNLIEGHNTHPLAIEKALKSDYSSDPALRALQLESKAHIEVQVLIEERLHAEAKTDVCSPEFLNWIHREFYERLPEEFRLVKTRSGGEDRVIPGELRQCEVQVGRHIPPTFSSLRGFLKRFAEAYQPDALDPLERIIVAAASHHRLAWIHPYLDGNGRVTRLFTHAYLIRVKIDGHRLWMVSRGLARRRDDYMATLASGDAGRRNDLDGRGNLSNEGLVRFCRFFLETAIDQVEFMNELLDLDSMQERILFVAERWVAERRGAKEIPHLLRDVFLRGEVQRGEAARILQKPERTARRILGTLLEEGLLVSKGPGDPVRIGFPAAAVGYHFPRLYPEGVEFERRKLAL